MKRASALFLIGTLVFAAIGVCGCALDSRKDASPNASIGIIETRGTAKTSRVVLYDRELNEVAELPLNYATVGNAFCNPLVYDGSLFTISQGRSKTKDGNVVLQVDLDSLSTKAYAIDQPAVNDVAASDEYVFTCNATNHATRINRCRADGGSVSSVSVEGVYVSKLVWHEDSLYAFASSLDDGSSTILHFDENLALQETIDCSTYDSDVYRTVAHNGSIYYCGTGLTGRQIGVLDTEDNTAGTIQLSKGGASSVAFANDKLYVARYNVVQGQDDSALSIVDLATGAIEEHFFDHGAMQMVATEGSLYILGNWAIYRYDAESMEFIGSKPIEGMPGNHSYLSGLFSAN
ncbi:hypothetical protein [Paraeggerthella hongkongensis]|uniref:Prolow-density lipoprotein receptor-related protein 1-like beta-propeller domain-containing protein n=1 Tax=Paraeggerthella hongkongensis TaxID=230658 RepID=A0A3N0BJF6_9ACTN|nr:hypothetical protein [Paraeggerthella hongkongensis]RNL48426.1 hypothetical protein DMP08_02110 [Paraeggerthella hongkongensis]